MTILAATTDAIETKQVGEIVNAPSTLDMETDMNLPPQFLVESSNGESTEDNYQNSLEDHPVILRSTISPPISPPPTKLEPSVHPNFIFLQTQQMPFLDSKLKGKIDFDCIC